MPAKADFVCVACSRTSRRIEPYRHEKHTEDACFADLAIDVCNQCGLGAAGPAIPDAELARYYDQAYKAANFAALERASQHVDVRSLSQLLLAMQYVEFLEDDLFLDVGAGAGGSFRTAELLLDRPQHLVVERKQQAIDLYRRQFPNMRAARGVDALGDVLGDQRVKLMLMSHVLEHLQSHEIIPTLTTLRRLLAPNGAFIIEVPHWDLRIWNSRSNDTPHLLFFTAAALRDVCRKGGFEVAFLGSCGPKYVDLPKVAAVSREVESPLLARFGRPRPSPLRRHFVKNGQVEASPDVSTGLRTLFDSSHFHYSSTGKVLRVVLKHPGH